MKPWSLQCLALFLLPCLLSSPAIAKDAIALVVDAPLTGGALPALADLEQALKDKIDVTRHDKLAGAGALAVVIGVAGSSKTVDGLLAAHKIDLPKEAESLCIRRFQVDGATVWLLAGRDTRGLSYALLEAAQAVQLSPKGSALLADVGEALEKPFLRVRSMTIHPFNEELDASWYFEESFWRGYFRMLAQNRYNNFTLTFSDQTNYLNPLYAYLVEVAEYPQVRVKGLTVRDRQRNLAMLQRIAELARERGLDFTLGIWTQAPVASYVPAARVENFPEGPQAADYCARGLKRVLQACPAINAIQFRMNAEAGVAEEKQTEFYQELFRAIAACGREIRLDLRFKGLRPATIKAARDLGLDVSVSTKFWTEHFGLPYHPTMVDRHYRDSRYSYGPMLAYPRSYRVVYQLWSVGSQRLLLWGDPKYAARFAESCRLGGGEGFEVFAPLTNKGYGNEPGAWRIFADRSLESYRWEYERYWFFYLAFGRLGYNPEAEPRVWRRELRRRFGDGSDAVEAAYRQASQVLPLLTATRLPSAGEWRWWPEMDTGGNLPEYMHTQTSDPAQFYAIRAWKRTPRWPWEVWDDTIPGYADDAVAGRLRGKITPVEISKKLRGFAEQTEQALADARTKVRDVRDAEFRATELDLHVLAELARYHADKTLAATHLAFFELTSDNGRLPTALKHMRGAEAAWERIVQRTDKSYHDNLVFGIPRNSSRSQHGRHHGGHWKDRLGEVREDVAHLQRLVQQHGADGKSFRTFPGEAAPTEEPMIEHAPLTIAKPGVDLPVGVRVTSRTPLGQIILHYRALDQTADWTELVMQTTGADRFQATIPGKAISERWDMQYYVEALLKEGGGRLWPSWEQGAPYVVMKVR